MLVIVSDLHLTDGSTGATTASGAFSIFADRLDEMALSASWRTDGSYRPLEQIDVVLLGDVLDVIRSTQWHSSAAVRPWSDPQSREFVDRVGSITDAILRHNEESLAVLRRLASPGVIRIPPAMRSATPARDGDAIPVSVRLHYMVGNHDWFFHHSNPALDAVRRSVIQRMGLCHSTDRPFVHDIQEDDDLLDVMRRHKVTARHGDQFDPFNFQGDRDASSLGDAIVIELVDRFAVEVESQLAGELPVATIVGLREIDNVRPMLLVPVWVDGLLERTCPSPATRKRVKTLWDRLVDDFLSLDFVRAHDTLSPFDLVDGLARALKFSKRVPMQWASSILGWLNGIRGAKDESYYSHALTEADFRNRRSRHIVYGHTHAAESVPLDASHAEGYVLNQMYFNSGTWRRMHRQTQMAPSQHEFIPADVMSYLAFFQGDQRRGRAYESWTGTLGYRPPEMTVHRVDEGAAAQTGPHRPEARPDPVRSLAAILEQPPHFLSHPARSRSGIARKSS